MQNAEWPRRGWVRAYAAAKGHACRTNRQGRTAIYVP